jgi:hypothetical protein
VRDTHEKQCFLPLTGANHTAEPIKVGEELNVTDSHCPEGANENETEMKNPCAQSNYGKFQGTQEPLLRLIRGTAERTLSRTGHLRFAYLFGKDYSPKR